MNREGWSERFSRFLFSRRPEASRVAALLRPLAVETARPGEAGLAVYRNNLLATVSEAVTEGLPRTCQRMGAEALRRELALFVYEELWRTSPPLLGLASHFADFLQERVETDCAELAALESAQLQVFFAPDSARLTREALAALLEQQGEGAALRLSASVRVLSVAYPVHRSDWSGPAPPANVDGPGARWHLVVWRGRSGRHHCVEAEPELWPVLSGIAGSETLGEIAGREALRSHPERLVECLSLLVERGWLAPDPARH